MSESPRISPGVRRLLVSELLIVVLIVAGAVSFRAMERWKEVVQQKPIEVKLRKVDVFRVEQQDYEEILTGFGTARADREVIVATQVAGEIISTLDELKVGTRVSTEDTLAQLDKRDLVQRKKQAESKVLEAEAEIKRLQLQSATVKEQLKQADKIFTTLKEDLDRMEELRSRNVGSKTELNRARLELQRYEDSKIQLANQLNILPEQIAAAQQRKEAARLEQEQSEIDLQRAEIKPPFDGIISEVFVEQGQYLRPGDRVIQLTAPEKLEIPISMGFEDYVLLANMVKGSAPDTEAPKVSFATNETSEQAWQGTLQRASPVADSQTRTVEVYAEVTNESDSSAPLLPGAFVFARIDGPVHRNRMLVPRTSVRGKGEEAFVYIVREVKTEDEASANSAASDNIPPAARTDKPGTDKPDESRATETAGSDAADSSKSTDTSPEDTPEASTQYEVVRVPVVTGREFQSLVEVKYAGDVKLQVGDLIATTNLNLIDEGTRVAIQEESDARQELSQLRVPLLRVVK
ncbi:MAG: efflux RND transporter periplasmic adaptor subunit [Planctomycetaceae bacterium]|nr:efflux RND transporter periplasmic adaptor subunit [Planctomycetaceae bacterium]